MRVDVVWGIRISGMLHGLDSQSVNDVSGQSIVPIFKG
jgi:hypothetical protein